MVTSLVLLLVWTRVLPAICGRRRIVSCSGPRASCLVLALVCLVVRGLVTVLLVRVFWVPLESLVTS